MEAMKVELILHSAQGLNNVKKMGTMDPYANIWIAGNTSDAKFRTNTAKNGGSNPVWDARTEIYIEQDASVQENLVLVCEIKHCGKVMDKKIGHVHVPLKHLLSDEASGEKVSYPVMTPTGKVEGTIILSYTVQNLPEGSLTLEGSNLDASGPTDDVASDPSPKEPNQTNNRKNRLMRNVVRVSTVMANTLSIAGSTLTLSGDRD